MKEEISALMDGEMAGDDADRLIAKLTKDDEAQIFWQSYHLIGDAIRGSCHHNVDLHKRICAKLAEEPTVLAPKRRRLPNSISKISWAIAASVATFSVVTWMHKQELATSQQFAQNAPVVQAPANDPIQSSNNLNEYVSAHEEFQPNQSTFVNTMFNGTTGQ